MGLHAETVHAESVEGCYGCKLEGLQVTPSAMPSRNGGGHAASTNAKEKRWTTDMASYKAMRDQGIQPRGIDGAHRLEGASDKAEVEMGHVFPDAKSRRMAREGMAKAQELIA